MEGAQRGDSGKDLEEKRERKLWPGCRTKKFIFLESVGQSNRIRSHESLPFTNQ